MGEDHSFPDLIRRVAARRSGGRRRAGAALRTGRPARVRLQRDSRMRRFLDSMDICQDVLASFFIRAASGQYDLDRPTQLLRLLAVMARNKLVSQSRTYYVARRESPGPAADAALAELETPETNPSGRLAWKDLLQEVRRRLTEDERRLADRRADGREWADIAAEVGGNPEALRKRLARALDRVRTNWDWKSIIMDESYSAPVLAAGPRASIHALLDDQSGCWQRGERPPAEDFLDRRPGLRGDADAALDLIYHEILLRGRRGEHPTLDEYVRRFPRYAEQLRAISRSIRPSHPMRRRRRRPRRSRRPSVRGRPKRRPWTATRCWARSAAAATAWSTGRGTPA